MILYYRISVMLSWFSFGLSGCHYIVPCRTVNIMTAILGIILSTLLHFDLMPQKYKSPGEMRYL